MNERFRELAIFWDGFWYRSYDNTPNLRRISPTSYRAGERCGFMTGFTLGCFSCLAVACMIIGWVLP